jgi:chromosome transmission fidelity protein 1
MENADADEPDWITETRRQTQSITPLKRKLAPKHGKTTKKPSLDLDEQIASMLKSMNSDENDDVNTGDTLPRKRLGPKIYFCSRTHSQLAQVMEALVKIVDKAQKREALRSYFNEFLAISLGARKNLCINKQISALSSAQRINEKCLELQTDSHGSCCPFYNETKEPSMNLLLNSIERLKVADIEDLHGLGEKIGACPYYASRTSQESADFIALPYNILLQKATRDAFGVELEGSLVIFDEAHNLIDAINQAHSIAIPHDSIKMVVNGLVQYFDRYSKRLSGSHVKLIQQLLHAASNINSFLDRTTQSQILSINEFLHQTMIDNLNAFPIQAYANESHLSQKISGFYSTEEVVKIDENLSSSTNLLNELIQFLTLLTSSESDGRVSIVKENDKILLKFISLNPEACIKEIAEKSCCVILAGGTMSPCQDFVLQLFGFEYPEDKLSYFSCGHLITKEHCSVLPLAAGPTSVEFDFTLKNRESSTLIHELGQTIMNALNVVPDGIVCFFPSYSYLEFVLGEWAKGNIFDALKLKRPVFIEGNSAKATEALIEAYSKTILSGNSKGALLFGVMGGRLSEGINFSDRLARLVLIVGLPFPNINDPETAERISYYVQRKSKGKPITDYKVFQAEYMENLCIRSVNQTIGMSIYFTNSYYIYQAEQYATKMTMRLFCFWISAIIKIGFKAVFRVGLKIA